MDNIIELECMHFWSDWTDIKKIEVDLSKYVFFSIEWRGENSWHIRGHYCDKNHDWHIDEISDHEVHGIHEVAKFINNANEYGKNHHQQCKVSRFNNLHYSGSFYSELKELFALLN
ncbi:MAG: hypothetical protein BV456_03525 [Thermoplasmata archaeon M8B2D]|nr:MAG: hypothetical protein BV456_03525 [Thermoplasmata archaeon M8B2D]